MFGEMNPTYSCDEHVVGFSKTAERNLII